MPRFRRFQYSRLWRKKKDQSFECLICNRPLFQHSVCLGRFCMSCSTNGGNCETCQRPIDQKETRL